MISANETQNGKHFRLFPVTETRNVALELGAGGTGRGEVGTVAALPWAGAWLLPSPRLSSLRLPREPEKWVRGDTCPAGETAFPRTGNLEAGVTSTAALEDAPNVSQRLRVIFAETGHSTDSLSLAIWADPPSGL